MSAKKRFTRKRTEAGTVGHQNFNEDVAEANANDCNMTNLSDYDIMWLTDEMDHVVTINAGWFDAHWEQPFMTVKANWRGRVFQYYPEDYYK
jgi:hypothetical protein